MKEKLTVTIEEDISVEIDKVVATGVFRNTSHFVEEAIKEALKNAKKEAE